MILQQKKATDGEKDFKEVVSDYILDSDAYQNVKENVKEHAYWETDWRSSYGI